eukprot:GAHX01000625.1.p1 GENE.GAHX01000625.1~~GAHX01000625.1.p1  ORF type:complete len:331 (+),score=63.99 GAHX01000625.1:43-1035(+)
MQFHDLSSSKAFQPILPSVYFQDDDPIYKPFAFVMHLMKKYEEFDRLAQTIKNLGKTVKDLRKLSEEQWINIKLPYMLKMYVSMFITKGRSNNNHEKSTTRSIAASVTREDFESDYAAHLSKIFHGFKSSELPTENNMEALLAKYNEMASTKSSRRDSYLQKFKLDIFQENAKKKSVTINYKESFENLTYKNEKLIHDFRELSKAFAYNTVASWFKGFSKKGSESTETDLRQDVDDFISEVGIDDETLTDILDNEGLDIDTMVEVSKKPESDEKLCVVCLADEAIMVILECMHLCLCEGCAEEMTKQKKVKKKECPICKQKVSKVRKIFK